MTSAGRSSTPLPVSVVFVTGPGEADGASRLDAIMTQYYPAFEVVLVSDGPLSASTAEAIARFQVAPVDLIYRPLVPTARVTACYHGATVPRLIVIEKERATYADAVNAGINAACSPYVCVVGAVTRMDRLALARLMAAVDEDPERVVAVSGIDRMFNGCEVRNGDVEVVALPRHPHLMVHALGGMRAALTDVGAGSWLYVPASSAPCLLLRRHIALQTGGLHSVPGAEFMDLLFRLHWTLKKTGHPYRMAVVSDPVTWTRISEDSQAVSRDVRQRLEGELRAVGRQLQLVHEMAPRQVGTWLASVGWGLAVLSPLFEVGGAVLMTAAFLLGAVSFRSLCWFGMATFAFRAAYSSAAIVVHDMTIKRYPKWGDLLGLFGVALIEPFIIRLRAAWWTLHALGAVLVRTKAESRWRDLSPQLDHSRTNVST